MRTSSSDEAYRWGDHTSVGVYYRGYEPMGYCEQLCGAWKVFLWNWQTREWDAQQVEPSTREEAKALIEVLIRMGA